MQVPVKLRDKDQVNAIFIAFEHGDVLNRFSDTYAVHNKFDVPCPKVVYGHKVNSYSIWHHPTQLASIRLVTWAAYEAQLLQTTRRFSDRSGWPVYMTHCQSCHGIGGQGATRGPDFLSNMEAYRRVPAHALTNEGQQPSLHLVRNRALGRPRA